METYGDACRAFARFLDQRGMPTTVDAIAREHVEAFIQELLTRWTPATAANRYRALQRFFGFAVEEGEITVSPMRNMSPPKIPDMPPDVLDEDQLRDLLKACDGPGFEDRRDAAILRVSSTRGRVCPRSPGSALRTSTSRASRCS